MAENQVEALRMPEVYTILGHILSCLDSFLDRFVLLLTDMVTDAGERSWLDGAESRHQPSLLRPAFTMHRLSASTPYYHHLYDCSLY